MKANELKKLSAKIRIDVLKLLKHRRYGHLGGSMSIVELLAVLYGDEMRYDVKNPNWEDRDYLVLSKGHSGPGLYSVLANVGFFDKEMLYTLNDGGTKLPSHPDRTKTPGVDVTTGSLGQGTSVAAGIAQALKMEGKDQYVYLIVGDGELNEGQCWEAFEFIAGKNLNNCIVFIDDNKRQLDGYTKDILNPYNIHDKMVAFGFQTVTVKGNDEMAIKDAIDHAKEIKNQPTCIVLDTIKGQGVKYFEDLFANHSVKFNDEMDQKTEAAIKELEAIVKGGKLNVEIRQR